MRTLLLAVLLGAASASARAADAPAKVDASSAAVAAAPARPKTACEKLDDEIRKEFENPGLRTSLKIRGLMLSRQRQQCPGRPPAPPKPKFAR